jgi:hypothetical protein
VKDGNGNLEDSKNLLNRWNNYFSQLMNVHSGCVEVHTAEQLVPGPSRLEVEIANAK